MGEVFKGNNYDTPVNVSGWTVQNSATGSDQNLTSNAGVSGTGLATQVAVQAATGQGSFTAEAGVSATGQASFVAPGTLAAAAKLSDLQAVAAAVDTLSDQIKLVAKLADLKTVGAAVDALNTAMKTAGVEASS